MPALCHSASFEKGASILFLLAYDRPEHARNYERISQESQVRAGLQLLDKLALRPGEAVLDLGCGTGQLTEIVCDRVGKSGAVVGIDMLASRIERAQLRSRPNLRFDTGVATDLANVAAAGFDVVYYNYVLHWIEDKVAAFTEAWRTLRPGGRIGMLTSSSNLPNLYSQARRQVLARAPYSRFTGAGGGGPFHVPAEEYVHHLVAQGFTDILVELLESPMGLNFRSDNEAFLFFETSSFGNYVGQLPLTLQGRALREIGYEVERLRGALPIENAGLLITATKPANQATDTD